MWEITPNEKLYEILNSCAVRDAEIIFQTSCTLYLNLLEDMKEITPDTVKNLYEKIDGVFVAGIELLEMVRVKSFYVFPELDKQFCQFLDTCKGEIFGLWQDMVIDEIEERTLSLKVIESHSVSCLARIFECLDSFGLSLCKSYRRIFQLYDLTDEGIPEILKSLPVVNIEGLRKVATCLAQANEDALWKDSKSECLQSQ